MNKKLILAMAIASIASGCATTDENIVVDEVAKNEITTQEPSITLDENGFITDDVAIVSISEESYLEEVDAILTEDGFSMRIDQAEGKEKAAAIENSVIYFSFDSSNVTNEMKKTVEAQLAFLQKYPKIKVILEGHTDERGSNAYNVILGEKRAKSVKNMLLKAGVKDEQIEIISYGEMKPLDSGTGESSWKQNRRVVFVYK
jgi:peptidoglycan-associated lipoprotein